MVQNSAVPNILVAVCKIKPIDFHIPGGTMHYKMKIENMISLIEVQTRMASKFVSTRLTTDQKFSNFKCNTKLVQICIVAKWTKAYRKTAGIENKCSESELPIDYKFC